MIIIGSGYGSAVTALRLTERGIPVTILERGRMWDKPQADGKIFCSTFEPDGRAMWFKNQTEVVVKSFAAIFPTSFAQRSARLLARLGFRREGYAKRFLLIDGRWRDHVLNALVHDAWRPEPAESYVLADSQAGESGT